MHLTLMICKVYQHASASLQICSSYSHLNITYCHPEMSFRICKTGSSCLVSWSRPLFNTTTYFKFASVVCKTRSVDNVQQQLSHNCETYKGFLLKKVKVCCLSGLKMDRTISSHFWISCLGKNQSLSLFQAYLSAHVSEQVLAKDPTSFMNLGGEGGITDFCGSNISLM